MDIELLGFVNNLSKDDFLMPTILNADSKEDNKGCNLSDQSCSILKKKVETIATFYDITLGIVFIT